MEGVGQTGQLVVGHGTLKELVPGLGISGAVELAGEGLGLNLGAGGSELDVLVLDSRVGARDDAGPEGEGGLVGSKLGDSATDVDTKNVGGGSREADDIERDYCTRK